MKKNPASAELKSKCILEITSIRDFMGDIVFRSILKDMHCQAQA